ncbi:NAD(P)-dependent alcohol dehydrogenase [Nannocystis pusilla]|uniref:NAD(P)-dependent alcohol dehydrogenase n=1 Tax=Nannocystis pusilla TaxID=889268 RepID=A0ABS7TZW4_9BACT|nr:NAD(P)-dependent alcohol dehydrogenase [Nannocystis pusilla]MBZ5713819.1 NAD(P)-dependent alcohol dehydrogenase [Nannocystis pusilla]
MRAAIQTSFGAPSVLELREVSAPACGDDEVLVRVRASTVSVGDARVRAMRVPRGFGWISRLVFGWSRPRRPILGVDVAGTIEAVGAKVQGFAPGDEVFALNGKMGGHAELCAISTKGAVAHKPRSLSHEQAAALTFGGTTALDFLRRAKLARGERVLVNGASGAVGTAAVQLAKHRGAHVTGVCSGGNLELVRSLGADEVIDYRERDFAAASERYDVILDAVGNAPYARCERVLSERGRLLLVVAGLPEMLSALWINATTRRRVIAGPAAVHGEDVRTLAALAESGALRPVIERTFSLEQIRDAHALVDAGHKRGAVVVRVS